jgi:hypothetical protein
MVLFLTRFVRNRTKYRFNIIHRVIHKLKGYMYVKDYIWMRLDGVMTLTRREQTSYAGKERAVSEVIGSIMLISIVVIGVAIVGVVIWSQPPPQKIPSLSTSILNESCKVILTHTGGDILENGSFKIYVDTDDRTPLFTKIGVPGPITTWEMGEILEYDPSPPCTHPPNTVRIVYTGESGATILSSAIFESSPLPPQMNVQPPQHTITASAGAGGAISPSGAVNVNEGTDQTFTISPNFGFHITDVIADGVSQGAITSYTFTGIEAAHTISASFAVTMHKITASAGAGGTISPSGDIVLNKGTNQPFTITPTFGYRIQDVLVDTISQGAVSTYTFTNVTANHTISASFVIATYTISVSSGAGGIIIPNGSVVVNEGANKVFAIIPTPPSVIADVVANGTSVGKISSYMFVNVTKNHTINAVFFSEFSYYREISVTNSPAIANYQMKVTVPWAAHMKNDFGDIRFIGTDGTTVYNYWMESKTDGSSAVFWVKVPTASTPMFRMYYGNASFITTSDGTTTFDFFDDFSNTLSKWTVEKTSGVYPRIESGYLVAGGGITSGTYGHTSLGSSPTYNVFQDGIVEFKHQHATDGIGEVVFRGNYAGNTGYKGRWDARAGSEQLFLKPPYSGWGNIGGAAPKWISAGPWYKGKLVVYGNVMDLYDDDSFKGTVTDTQYTGAGEIALQNHYGSFTNFDDVRVRKYASPEPTTSIGSEIAF